MGLDLFETTRDWPTLDTDPNLRGTLALSRLLVSPSPSCTWPPPDMQLVELIYLRGVIPSIASTIIYNLPYGGPVSMIWGWALSSFLIMFIGLAMVSLAAFVRCILTCVQGELASAMPTSGGTHTFGLILGDTDNSGLYFWTHRLADPEYRNFLAWLVGCTFIVFVF